MSKTSYIYIYKSVTHSEPLPVNVCLLTSIRRHFEGCLGGREMRHVTARTPPRQICLILKMIRLETGRTTAASWAEGSHRQEVKAVHFLRRLLLLLIVHTQGCPGSQTIKNDLCQRAYYKNHLSFLVRVWIWRMMLGSDVKAGCKASLWWVAKPLCSPSQELALGFQHRRMD